jgi:anti-sigma regulatory factor (Ser/Thr protein kinase)
MAASLENCIHTTKKYYAAPDIKKEEITNDSYSEYIVNASSQKSLIETIESIEKKLLEKNISPESVNEAVIAVSEIIQNAQEHSCKFSPNKKIYVSVLATPKYFLAGVGNKGKALNISKTRELLDKYDSASTAPRGRGFEMIRRTTDIIYVPQLGRYSETIIGKIID